MNRANSSKSMLPENPKVIEHSSQTITDSKSTPVRPVSAYVAIGARLINFTVDHETEQLTQRDEIALPSRVQYVWPHATLPILYVACADRAPGAGGQPFYLCALLRDKNGNLRLHGNPVALPSRPVHLTTDLVSRYVLTAYSAAPGLTVHVIHADGTIGNEIHRVEPFEYGTYPHQVRITPSKKRVILVDRGKKGFGNSSYVAGGLKVLSIDQGRVKNLYTVNPREFQTTSGFNPRHMDFHPTKPLVYVSLEGQNKLCVFRIQGEEIDPAPLFTHDMLARPAAVRPRQDGGTVHVHPNGRYVYVANRNDGYIGGHKGPSWLTPDPIPVFPGGENNIAVFAIDDESGEPTLIQNADSHGLHPRTFAIDPAGRILIAANVAPTFFRDGDSLNKVPANLALFRVQEDGRLEFLRRYDLDVGSEMIWWMGIA